MNDLTIPTSVPALMDYCRTALEGATSFDEVRDVRDQLEAARLQLGRVNAGLDAQNAVAEWKLRAERELGRRLAAMEMNRGGEPMKASAEHPSHGARSGPPTLGDLGINYSQSSRWQTIARVDSVTFNSQIDDIKSAGQELTSGKIYNEARKADRKADIAAQREAIEAGTATMPAGVFEVISIDPPWPYGWIDQYDPQNFRVSSPYPEMSLGDLAARLAPDGDLAIPSADDAVLWCWTTHRFLPHTFPLLEAWGFEYKVTLTWAKDRFGVGRWLRSQSEFCLMAVKGRPVIDLGSQSTLLEAPMRQHSRKPAEFYDMVDSLCVGRKLDVFSREPRRGWSQFGNERAKFDDGDGTESQK